MITFHGTYVAHLADGSVQEFEHKTDHEDFIDLEDIEEVSLDDAADYWAMSNVEMEVLEIECVQGFLSGT
jgi:hypothetical protein